MHIKTRTLDMNDFHADLLSVLRQRGVRVSEVLKVRSGGCALWRQYGVLAGLRIQLTIGLTGTTAKPTSMPTLRHHLTHFMHRGSTERVKTN